MFMSLLNARFNKTRAFYCTAGERMVTYNYIIHCLDIRQERIYELIDFISFIRFAVKTTSSAWKVVLSIDNVVAEFLVFELDSHWIGKI